MGKHCDESFSVSEISAGDENIVFDEYILYERVLLFDSGADPVAVSFDPESEQMTQVVRASRGRQAGLVPITGTCLRIDRGGIGYHVGKDAEEKAGR